MTTVASPTQCRANIDAGGIRRRRLFGHVGVAVTLVIAIALVGVGAPWYLRALLLFPAAGTTISYLQAVRTTCVAHALHGTIEHDGHKPTPAPAEELAASRKVAMGIGRDAALVGLVVAVIAAASAWVW